MPQTLHLKLTIDGYEVEAAVEVPEQPSPRRLLLPILQRLADTVVHIAEQSCAAKVSCRKGCDACCRQMVPISPTEAYALAALMERVPPRRVAAILEGFDRGRERLADVGLLGRLQDRQVLTSDQQRQLDRDYFAADVACPFLEDCACGIYPDRPLACREFLVTSPAEHCQHPTADKVTQLPLSAKVSLALIAQDQNWLPLILARDFVSTHPELISAESPAQSLQQILSVL
ncbi:MAG: YkgJ family cysteine cluster protein [Phycisphaerales bacterium]|nr:YkgJ family cysteine cluster protein [Phycisphaerales bacterium]